MPLFKLQAHSSPLAVHNVVDDDDGDSWTKRKGDTSSLHDLDIASPIIPPKRIHSSSQWQSKLFFIEICTESKFGSQISKNNLSQITGSHVPHILQESQSETVMRSHFPFSVLNFAASVTYFQRLFTIRCLLVCSGDREARISLSVGWGYEVFSLRMQLELSKVSKGKHLSHYEN